MLLSNLGKGPGSLRKRVDGTRGARAPSEEGYYLYKQPSSRKSSREVGGRVREVGGPDPPGVLPQNCGGNEPNRTDTCSVLKSTAYDMRHLAFCHDEFRGPRSGLYRSGDISNYNDNSYTKNIHLSK
ncbi:hypothetical protein TNCV_3807611 [Trichonephila clavipes]|nr:hypothetical protein TNCV_3807611 [Trichonephila clavipes]